MLILVAPQYSCFSQSINVANHIKKILNHSSVSKVQSWTELANALFIQIFVHNWSKNIVFQLWIFLPFLPQLPFQLQVCRVLKSFLHNSLNIKISSNMTLNWWPTVHGVGGSVKWQSKHRPWVQPFAYSNTVIKALAFVWLAVSVSPYTLAHTTTSLHHSVNS